MYFSLTLLGKVWTVEPCVRKWVCYQGTTPLPFLFSLFPYSFISLYIITLFLPFFLLFWFIFSLFSIFYFLLFYFTFGFLCFLLTFIFGSNSLNLNLRNLYFLQFWETALGAVASYNLSHTNFSFFAHWSPFDTLGRPKYTNDLDWTRQDETIVRLDLAMMIIACFKCNQFFYTFHLPLWCVILSQLSRAPGCREIDNNCG